MRFKGEWLLGDDERFRPIIRAKVLGANGSLYPEAFLIDTGADATVFSSTLLYRLNYPSVAPPPPERALIGIGGGSDSVQIRTVLVLTTDDGRPKRFHSAFFAFTNPTSADLSILGRDVLDHCDVIVSRRLGDVVLLSDTSRYSISDAP